MAQSRGAMRLIHERFRLFRAQELVPPQHTTVQIPPAASVTRCLSPSFHLPIHHPTSPMPHLDAPSIV